MAVRLETFRKLGIDKIWSKALSDDLSLTYAVKKAKLKIAFVPACLVASYESTTWSKLFEFGRRQFLITRISRPSIWWFGLLSCLFSILGLWAGAALAIYAAAIDEKRLLTFAAVPTVFLLSHICRAVLRQSMIRKILKDDWPKMKAACIADVLFSWVWSLLMLVLIISSAFGRTIRWRGIKYKLTSPTDTTIID